MLAASRYGQAISAEAGEIGRRLQALEKSLVKIGARASTSGRETAEDLGNTIASALSGWSDRFRQAGDQYGKDAANLGTVALTRITDQTGRRPLVALAIALGVGILIGIAMRNSRTDLSK
jgi:ElaB/YqjD/DUF883 family membrane-anchored ribosome-binding protein